MSNLFDSLNQEKKNMLKTMSLVLLLVAILGIGFLITADDGTDRTANNTESAIPSSWLVKYFGTDDVNADFIGGDEGDPDGDLLSNFKEFYFNTDPTLNDTDGDSQYDGVEVILNRNPNGEGGLYGDDKIKETVEKFVKETGYEELSEENILAFANDLFLTDISQNPEFYLPEESDIKIAGSNYDIDDYLSDVDSKISAVTGLSRDLSTIVLNENLSTQQGFTQEIEGLKNDLLSMEVPGESVDYHRLLVAQFDSMEKLMNLLGQIDDNVSLELQKDKTRLIIAYMQQLQEVSDLATSRYQDLLTNN